MSGLSLLTRIRVLERDGYRCVYCGRTSADVALQVDHVVPRKLGGQDDGTNLVTACFECNNGKRAHTLRLPDGFVPIAIEATQRPAATKQRAATRGTWKQEAERRYPDAADMSWLVGRGNYASVSGCAGLTVSLSPQPDRTLIRGRFSCGHACWQDHEVVDLLRPEVLSEAIERERLARRVEHFRRCPVCRYLHGEAGIGDAIERTNVRLLDAARQDRIATKTHFQTLADIPTWDHEEEER